jgi:S1-C subfamily serine protease
MSDTELEPHADPDLVGGDGSPHSAHEATPVGAGAASGLDGDELEVGGHEPDATATSDAIDTTTDPDTPGVGDEPASGPDPQRKSRSAVRREWRQSERARRYASRRSVRFPVFTRSVLIWMLVFALFGMAFGVSGAFWWAHFNTQVNTLREETKGVETRSQEAQSEIAGLKNQAVTEINDQLKPLAPFVAESRTIQLAQVFAPYVWFVATLDENGYPSVGSAFPVVTDDASSLLITSYETVKASAVTPGPDITLSKGQDEMKARLVSIDPERDLALLSVDRGQLPVMDWATDDVQAQALGSRVFPVSGLGGAGASLTSGIVIDQNAAGFLHTAPIGNAQQGGPVVTPDGKVIGVASVTYRPFGFDPGEVHYSIGIAATCDRLLECGGGVRKKKDGAPAPGPGGPVND